MEPDNLNPNPSPAPASSGELTQGEKTAMTWAILAFGFAVFFHIFNTSYMVRHAGFFAKVFSVIVATGLGTIGADRRRYPQVRHAGCHADFRHGRNHQGQTFLENRPATDRAVSGHCHRCCLGTGLNH